MEIKKQKDKNKKQRKKRDEWSCLITNVRKVNHRLNYCWTENWLVGQILGTKLPCLVTKATFSSRSMCWHIIKLEIKLLKLQMFPCFYAVQVTILLNKSMGHCNLLWHLQLNHLHPFNMSTTNKGNLGPASSTWLQLLAVRVPSF